MKKYKYKNLVIKPYWNGYDVYYAHENGNMDLLVVGSCCPTRKIAMEAGKQQVDAMNRREKAK